jgi:hypothetical protein
MDVPADVVHSREDPIQKQGNRQQRAKHIVSIIPHKKEKKQLII